jgi:hypothetical protein
LDPPVRITRLPFSWHILGPLSRDCTTQAGTLAMVRTIVDIPAGVAKLEASTPRPSWTKELSPQHLIPPSERRAQVWTDPAVSPVTLESPLTVTGVDESLVVPLPSWPSAFMPQHLTVPSESNAQLWDSPTATAVAVEIPLTVTGTVESVSVPLPSWPKLLDPQHRTVPPEITAQTCSLMFPDDIAVAVEIPLTATGTDEKLVVVPFPSWPT